MSFQDRCSTRNDSVGVGGNTAARVLLLALLLDCCCFAHSRAAIHIETALAREKTIPKQGKHRGLIGSRYFYCSTLPPPLLLPAVLIQSPLRSSACVLLQANYGGEGGTRLNS
jgi:hypothetical protein